MGHEMTWLKEVLDILRTYWLVILLGCVAVGLLFFSSSKADELAKVEEDIVEMQATVEGAKKTLAEKSKDLDKDAEKKVIQERTVSAEKIGEEIIKVDDVLTAFYKSAKDLPEDEAEYNKVVEELNWAKKENTRLTGAGEADHINTWQLNPEWTLKLESVVVYRDTDRIPVVFSMKTKEGKNAGLIQAVYDVEKNQITDVVKHYTNDGIRDEVNVGGS